MDGCVKSSDPAVAFSLFHWTFPFWKGLNKKLSIYEEKAFPWNWFVKHAGNMQTVRFQIRLMWTLDVTSSYDMRTLLTKGHWLHVKSHFLLPRVLLFLPSTFRSRTGNAIAVWWLIKCSLNRGLEWEPLDSSGSGGQPECVMASALPILACWWCLGRNETGRTVTLLPFFNVPIN